MYTRRRIIPLLGLFLAACLFPFLLNSRMPSYTGPELSLPQGETACVESLEVMRTDHMRLLQEWRDAAVRQGKRLYTASDGKVWEASLQNTCMSCHTDRQRFCASCHTANNVSPDCWSCHIAPETPGAQRLSAKGGNTP